MSDNPLQHDLDDELLSAYLDDELTDQERTVVEARLATDPAARQMLDELRHVAEAVRGLPRQSPRRDLRESILRQATEAKDMASPAAAAESSDQLPRVTIGRTRRSWIWASLAVAAALLIMFVQREAAENENERSVALHRREPAFLTPSPEPAQPSRRLAESRAPAAETAMSRSTADAASDAVSQESIERYAPAPPEPTEELDEQQLVVVHVLAKRKSLEQKTFDQLLISNGIAVEPDSPKGQAAPTTERNRALSSDLADLPAAAQPADQEAADVDVVLVEAPPTTIMSCLADLNQDYANYLSVSVDESAAAQKLPGFSMTPAKKLAADLGKYSRGVVPQQQKDWFARDKALYYQQSPDSGGFRGGLGGGIDAPPQINLQDNYSALKQNVANQARAQRVHVSNAEDRQGRELSRLGQAVKKPARSDDENLQVLFVLSPSDESAASPAAENRPE